MLTTFSVMGKYAKARQPDLEANAAAAMEECVQRILNDIDGAIGWVIESKDDHPNRLDVIRDSHSDSLRGRSTRGGRGARGGRDDFASRTEATPANPFLSAGASPFGQQQTQSGFGQSPFGQAQPAGGFGSGFGQVAQGGFVQSPFGQPQVQNGFGQTAAFSLGDEAMQDEPMNSGAFGQIQAGASPFGQATLNNSPFGHAQAQPQAQQMAVEEVPSAMFGLNEEQFKQAYEQARQAGGFADGAVPMIAPKSEWNS
jgi:nucleoporin NUP42